MVPKWIPIAFKEDMMVEIEDEDPTLACDLLVMTVGNGNGGGLVDNSENVQAGDGTTFLGVVEVCGNK